MTATLITAVVLVTAIRSGAYPESLRHGLDFGVSYGSITATTAITWYLPRKTRAVWAGVCVLYPFTAASWYGWVPDFTTLGHVAGALYGLAAGHVLCRDTSGARKIVGTPAGLPGEPAGGTHPGTPVDG